MNAVGISIKELGKKFNSEWIFRNLNYEIAAEEKLVILGGNGSGKSTLLQVLSGYVSPTEGEIKLQSNNSEVKEEEMRKHIAFASPYLQLIEDLTLAETIEHSLQFKPLINKLTVKEVMDIIELAPSKNKFIKQFSSGMKQRLKLGLAFLSDTGLLLLDEPVSNLDKNAIKWYKNMVEQYALKRTTIVCSNNIDDEYFFCTKQLNVADFKGKP